MYNLKTFEGRRKALGTIEFNFLNNLRNIGVELSDSAACKISDRCIQIGVTKNDGTNNILFASEIDLYRATTEDDYDLIRANQINFGSSGAFSPNETASYWRTIHAASILKNWEGACKIINEHCKMYKQLAKKIDEENK